MPFTRQRPDGTHDAMRISTELFSTSNTSRWIERRIPLLTLAAMGFLGHSAEAKPAAKPLTGVWGWTSGSQTYLRARPSAQTPPVAKVARHTKLFVWGKFNGWYRVETTDHVFGWVYYDYIAAPEADKIVQLSHKKARLASDRTSHQTMYGSKEMLVAHYDRYGAKGAVRGLKKQGISIGSERLAKAVKPKSSPRIVSTRMAAGRTVSSIKRIPGSDRYALNAEAQNISQPNFNDVGSVRLTPTFERDSRSANNRSEGAQRDATRSNATQKSAAAKAEATRIARLNAEKAAAEKAAAEKARFAKAELAKAAAAKAEEAQNEAARTRAANVQAEKARAANAEKARLARIEVERRAETAKQIEVERRAETAKQTAEANLAAQRRANYQARLAAREREHKARRARAAARAAARQKKLLARRNSLRDKLGTPRMAEPPTNAAGMRPISPDELMRARDAYLASQRRNRPLGESSVVVVPAPGNPAVMPMSWSRSRGNNSGAVLLPSTLVAPKSSKMPMRGGSPRDRFAASPNAFGNGMADQALTYRGMPYVRGASSPRSGFDCSGLVYFLLRQRGIKAPHSAAGMASMGRSVSRGDLKSGDIVFFANTYKRGVSHVGVYIGNGNFVHAATSREGVRVDSLSSAYYRKKWYGARRISK